MKEAATAPLAQTLQVFVVSASLCTSTSFSSSASSALGRDVRFEALASNPVSPGLRGVRLRPHSCGLGERICLTPGSRDFLVLSPEVSRAESHELCKGWDSEECGQVLQGRSGVWKKRGISSTGREMRDKG